MVRTRHRSRVFWIWGLLLSTAGTVQSGAWKDESMFFDRAIPDYETVLTPGDFEMAAQMSPEVRWDADDIWDSEAMYGADRFEGDIANPHLNATTVELFLNGCVYQGDNNKLCNAIRNRYQLWPDNKIPYAISSQYSSYSRSLIASSMQEYATQTCLQFVPRTNQHNNYIYIYPDRGCYSMVGKTGGKQTVSLGSGCIQKGIIIHELMHAVGFFHEQSRTDRDNFITINWNNIQPGMQGQFEKYGQGTIQTLGTEYDYGSIMHYGSRAFSRNGMPTIVPKKTVSIGQRNGFSKVDSFKINKLYGCPTDSGVVTTTADPSISTVEPSSSTAPPPETSSTRPYPSPPTLAPSTTPPPEDCKDTRIDCPDLAEQGWCKRNPGWMKKHCPVSCGMCEKKPTTQLPPVTPTCEDLRVDCAQLVQQRYCKTSQTFMKTYCARACGFCFAPPATELPNTLVTVVTATTPPATVTTSSYTTAAPTTHHSTPRRPLPITITFWPFIGTRMTTTSPTTTALPPTPLPPLPQPRPIVPIIGPPPPESTSTVDPPSSIVVTQRPPPVASYCRDRKHFCLHWKQAGFCNGIFHNYMKKNCQRACNMC